MRKTRLLYVENDGALRRILGEILAQSQNLDLVGSFANADQVLDRAIVRGADVALLDFSLDQNGLNGIELGIAMRNFNEHIGIVIYSQFAVSQMVSRVPRAMRHGWSFLEKSAEMSLSDYVEILQETASGNGNWDSFSRETVDKDESQASIYFRLSPQQRSIMSMSSQGKSAKEIAAQLNLSYSHIRKELSRSYAILLPDASSSEDLKTAAVLKYMELVRLS
jgi:DNA-binding NarL/FixJ family response regulator